LEEGSDLLITCWKRIRLNKVDIHSFAYTRVTKTRSNCVAFHHCRRQQPRAQQSAVTDFAEICQFLVVKISGTVHEFLLAEANLHYSVRPPPLLAHLTLAQTRQDTGCVFPVAQILHRVIFVQNSKFPKVEDQNVMSVLDD
jgi:hypothetical protein